MAIASIALPQPIRARQEFPRRDFALRDQAITEFEAGAHLDALHHALRYMLPEQSQALDLRAQALCVIHGSARVRVELQGDDLCIRAAIARIDPERSQVPAALRYFLSNASGTGQLFQARLSAGENSARETASGELQDLIYLEYRDPLRMSHPHKVIEVLGRMPVEADRFDGWIVDQFSLDPYDREPLQFLSEAEKANACSLWQSHWAAIEELQNESRRRRSVRFLNFLASFASSYIGYCLPVSGRLRSDLAEASDVYNNRDETPDKRDNALAKHVKAMRALSDAELLANLQHARYAFNPLYEGTISLLNQVLGAGQSMQSTGDARASGRALEAAFELITNYAYLLSYHSWPAEIEQSLREALDAVSEKPWREAAEFLWTHAAATVKRFGVSEAGDAGQDEDADEQGYRE
jgi:hypothetical protein